MELSSVDFPAEFEPMTETEIAALLEKTAEYAVGARYERYKTFVKKPGKVIVHDEG